MTSREFVGWFDRTEWKEVCYELYSKSSTAQRHAVNRIAVWKSRMANKLPVSIECSAALVQATLDDRESVKLNQSKDDNFRIRMTYSMALLRFVNSITETFQNGRYAQPVHILAKSMGLPDWLVDLRHEASHTSIPSLTLLRAGADFALGWLKSEYWENKMYGPTMSALSPTVDDEICVEDTMVKYMQCQFESYEYHINHEVIPSNVIKKIRKALERMDKLVKIQKDLAIRCILQDGYITPTDEQLNSLAFSKDYINAKTLNLPYAVVFIWTPFLKVIKHQKLMHNLISEILSTVKNSENLRTMLLCGWLLELMPKYKLTNGIERYNPIRISHADMNWKQILNFCMNGSCPTAYRNDILARVLEIAPFTDSQKSHLQTLFDICNERQVSDIGEKEIFTVEDLKGPLSDNDDSNDPEVEDSDSQKNMIEVPSISKWQSCRDGIDWTKYPLGTVPGTLITYKNLELWSEDMDTDADINDSDIDESDVRTSGTRYKQYHWTVKDLNSIKVGLKRM